MVITQLNRHFSHAKFLPPTHSFQRKELFYERFNDYVKNNHFSPENFWSVNKEKLQADEFKECLEVIGFHFSKDEFEDVMFDVADTKFFVTLPAFCAKIEFWKAYAQGMMNYTMKYIDCTYYDQGIN